MVPTWLLDRLACPSCRGTLVLDRRVDILAHDTPGCSEQYPIIEGVPRLVIGAARAVVLGAHPEWFAVGTAQRELRRLWSSGLSRPPGGSLVRDFDFEWSTFRSVGTSELTTLAERYFDLLTPDLYAPDAVALDAGCGAGRWAYDLAKRGVKVIAMDLGASIDVARRNTAELANVACVQGDIERLPMRTGSMHWSYSLGVIHHLPQPDTALAELIRVTRKSGSILVYIYYALDGRGPLFRAIFRVADLARRLISRAPRWLALGFASLTAVLLYYPLARFAHLLDRVGLTRQANAVPLSFYRDLPLRVMMNDSLDRFGTRVERRYSRSELVAMMTEAGLRRVKVSDHAPYWHAIGVVGEPE